MKLDHQLWIGFTAFIVVGLGFLWPAYAMRMWNAGHYQFFVFVLAVVAWLLWSRKAEIAESSSSPSAAVTFFLWLAIAGLIAFSNIAYSGLAGIVATIFAGTGGIYSVYGWGGLRSASGVLWLLGFAVPLPLLFDQALIIKMQVLASELASRLLDGAGVIHFRQGVIIETPVAKFMTEEACSGIRSLFSSMAVVAIYGVLSRHRAWRIAINLAQTVLWVLVGNSLRVAIVVALAGSYPWIASGWGHDALGLVVFGFILIMVASTDVALTRWIRDLFVIDAKRQPPDTDVPGSFVLAPFPVSGVRAVMLFGVLVSMSLVALRTAWVRQTANTASLAQTFAAIADPGENDFQGQYAGFTQQSFTHMTRGTNAMLAQNSFVYQFKRNHLQTILSIDRPWNHWHNLHFCYSNLGWKSTPTYAISRNDLTPSIATSPHRHSELILTGTERYGFVIYSAIDRVGAHVPETAVMDANGIIAAARLRPHQIIAALGFGGRKDQQVATVSLPVSTIQVYAESLGPWNEEDLNDIRNLFFSLREEITTTLKQ